MHSECTCFIFLNVLCRIYVLPLNKILHSICFTSLFSVLLASRVFVSHSDIESNINWCFRVLDERYQRRFEMHFNVFSSSSTVNTTLKNLGALYRRIGKTEEAETVEEIVSRARKNVSLYCVLLYRSVRLSCFDTFEKFRFAV